MKINHHRHDGYHHAYLLNLWGSHKLEPSLVPAEELRMENLKEKEKEEKSTLCSNWLLVCNLPHEEEP